MQNIWSQKVVALTGTTGSGKSTLCEYFSEFGLEVLSADKLAKEIVCPGESAYKEILQVFGEEILVSSGEIDRRALGRLVFNSEQHREKLEAITHPRIDERAKEIFSSLTGEFHIYDVPLLFESNLKDRSFRAIICLICDENLSIERIVQRDKLSEAEARARVATQFPAKQKASLSDYVIENNGTLKDLKNAALKVIGEIKNEKSG